MNASVETYLLPGKFGQLALKVTDVGLEAIALSYFDGEKMAVVLLGLPVSGVLSEERFDYLIEVVERMWQKRIEPI